MDYIMVKSNDTLEGMHPTLRQVPPREPSFSTHVILRPILVALMVATYPLGPLPTTTTSFSSADADEYVCIAPRHLPKPSEEEEEAGINALWIKANWPFHFPAIATMDG